MIVKYIYDVVYDTLELLEEGGHTYSMDANKVYKEMTAEHKITDYKFVLNKDTLTRTTTITYASLDAFNEHIERLKKIKDNAIVPGRIVTNQYLIDGNDNIITRY
jgi:uncharacterized protein YktB (UPF0637 family)